MSAVTNLIPKIEGFQPIPNAVMIPFMEAQSAALAYGFGLNYEFGKRKIRSMSNEEFNSLTSEQIAALSNAHTHIILQAFQAAVPRVMPMQQEIFKQYVEIEKQKVLQNVALAKWVAINAPSILLGGTTSDDVTNIRDTTKTGDRLAIGTQVGGQVIVGYIDGVPQYSPIPKPTRTDRAGSTTPPPPQAPVNPLDVIVKVVRIGNRLAWFNDMNKSQPVFRWIERIKNLNGILNRPSSTQLWKDQSLGSIYMIRTALHAKTGKWY